VVQETRLYDAAANETRTMRSKEDADDYRYFPDPDLLPIRITTAEFDTLRAALPELPDARRARYIDALGLTPYDAGKLTEDRATSDYFEAVLGALPGQAKLAANWVNGELAAALNEAQIDLAASRIAAADLAALLARIVDGTVSGKIAKDVFAAMWAGEGSADAIIDAKGLRQISDSGAIGRMLDEVLAQFPDQVAKCRGACRH
jgi:aspartyl-tRNA(Asn)/glutamyl-tRNA(Gln) amidotransferase subunit B